MFQYRKVYRNWPSHSPYLCLFFSSWFKPALFGNHKNTKLLLCVSLWIMCGNFGPSADFTADLFRGVFEKWWRYTGSEDFKINFNKYNLKQCNGGISLRSEWIIMILVKIKKLQVCHKVYFRFPNWPLPDDRALSILTTPPHGAAREMKPLMYLSFQAWGWWLRK